MSSDMLSNLLNDDEIIEVHKNYRDFYLDKWKEEIAKTCKCKKSFNICRLTEGKCNFKDCYRRNDNHGNY